MLCLPTRSSDSALSPKRKPSSSGRPLAVRSANKKQMDMRSLVWAEDGIMLLSYRLLKQVTLRNPKNQQIFPAIGADFDPENIYVTHFR